MAIFQLANCRIWFDESLIEQIHTDVFDITYWQKKGSVLGQAKGRGITWFVQTDRLPAALRHYHRGGLIGKLLKDRYFFTGFDQSRAAKEFVLLDYLYQHQLAVPRPIAARVIRAGLSYTADILVEKIEGAADLVSLLKKAPLDEADYHQIGSLISQMHQLQICHTDLNIHNILRDDKGKFWLIDFDKCGKKAGNSWKKANLSRLYRSFLKEVKKEQIHFELAHWQQLLASYHASN